MRIDLNADLGEGCPFDAELMALITSASISCGGHAGNEQTVGAAIQLAKQHGVRIGAHPGFPDRQHFGRRELKLPPSEIYEECAGQLSAFTLWASALNASVRYLKPHGALYNMACRDAAIAEPVARVAAENRLAVMGLPNSRLAEVARQRGLTLIAEGFADRRYLPNSSLAARSQPNAFIETAEEAVEQVEWLIRECGVQSICVHGDNPKAVALVRRLRESLAQKGHELSSDS